MHLHAYTALALEIQYQANILLEAEELHGYRQAINELDVHHGDVLDEVVAVSFEDAGRSLFHSVQILRERLTSHDLKLECAEAVEERQSLFSEEA